jgi:hypothetical protein
MRIRYLILILSLTICFGSFISAIGADKSFKAESGTISSGEQDITENQILYNGRAWRNRYTWIRGNQFLFSSDFQPGTVTISDKLFKHLEVRYDIYSDEIMIKSDQGIILQLNKEMVNSFTMDFNNKTYDFLKLEKDSLNPVNGYVNVLYRGNVSLFVKYTKEILLLAVDNRYDLFGQSHRIYIRKDGAMHQVSSKNDIIGLFKENKQKIKSFIKSNKIKVSKMNPESFIPVVDFCNSF